MAKAKKNHDENNEKASASNPTASDTGSGTQNQAAPVTQKRDSKKAVETPQKAKSKKSNAPPKEEASASQAKLQKPEESSDETTASASDKAQTAADQAVSSLDGMALPASSGKAGVLGGPKDRGIKPDDKLALPVGRHFTFERIRSLNPKSFYCAMRWDYHLQGKSPEESKRWWANKKLLVTNPANGSRIIVRAVDFGPHENTGLTISLSPGALEALGLEIGGEVQIEFADQKAPLGVVTE